MSTFSYALLGKTGYINWFVIIPDLFPSMALEVYILVAKNAILLGCCVSERWYKLNNNEGVF